MPDKGLTLNSRYKLIRHIRSGGMGGVYEAFDANLKVHVAIKESLFEEESLRAAFRREAQLLANLRHPSLPHCSDFFSHGTKLYLVMDFIEGDDLAAILSKRRVPFAAAEVLGWAGQMLDVLEYLHGEGILHRDVKPSNMKVVRGRVYLLDFGIAYGQSGEMDTIAGGEFNWRCHSIYSPPEQSRCERTSPASDLYALATTLYNLLTGVRPVDANSRFRALARGEADPLKNISSYCPGLCSDVRRAIISALSMDPRKRPQSVGEMREMMFLKVAPRPEPKSPRASLRGRVAAGLLVLCASSGLLLPALASLESKPAGAAHAASEVAAPACPREDEAERLMRGGKYEEATRVLSEALSDAPGCAYLHFLYGDLLWDTNDEGAESAADMKGVQEQADIILGLVQAPTSEKEFIARSWASLAKGDLDSAFADANEALRLNPRSGAGSMLRGTIRYEQAVLGGGEALKSAAAAITADYDVAVEIMGDYPQVYVNRARIRAALGDFDPAVADIEHAIELLPRAGYYYELGCAYYGAERFKEARGSFQKAVALNPNHYKAHCGLADIRFKRGDWKGALAEYLSANKIQETVYASGQIGWAYKNLGRYEDARKNFDAALRHNRYDFISHYGLAAAYVGLKDFKSALAAYDNALTYAPKGDAELLSALQRERARVRRELG
jgi:tetratricopeptide (TPR) repeat protein